MLSKTLDLPSDDLVCEQAYLVSRGVRPLVLIGMSGISVSTAYGHLWRLCDVGVTGSIMPIPFAFDNPKTERICCGFAAYPWIIELLKSNRTVAPDEPRPPKLRSALGVVESV